MPAPKPRAGVRTTGKRAPKQPKKKERPTAAAFRAGAARLDLVNSMATKRRVPAIIDLSSASEVPEDGMDKTEAVTEQYRTPAASGQQAPPPMRNSPSRRENVEHDGKPPGRAHRARPVILDSEEEGKCLLKY